MAKFCKRGHLRTPDNVNKNGACIACNVMTKAQKRAFDKKAAQAQPQPRAAQAPDSAATRAKKIAALAKAREAKKAKAQRQVFSPPIVAPQSDPKITPSAAWAATKSQSKDEAIIAKFRTIATALGKDPTAMLAECAQGWLDVIHEAVDRADADARGDAVVAASDDDNELPPPRDAVDEQSEDDENGPFQPGNVEEVRARGA